MGFMKEQEDLVGSWIVILFLSLDCYWRRLIDCSIYIHIILECCQLDSKTLKELQDDPMTPKTQLVMVVGFGS